MNGPRILVLRLGAMGDVIHALPAVAALKRGLPGCHITWTIDRKWAPLLAGNPFVDALLPVDGSSLRGLLAARTELRRRPFDLAIDFQGLLKSAMLAASSRADRIFGFHASLLREPGAALFYSRAVSVASAHVVDRNMELSLAAGAAEGIRLFPLPEGAAEGGLPAGPFVLACPLAGWVSKQWPMPHWSELASRLGQDGLSLVLNGPPAAEGVLRAVPGVHVHVSGLPGLIHATRRAAAVVGVDSGPLHVAAALAKPGVAIFGPTDPARNGPYGGTIDVLRSAAAETSYRRRSRIDASMLAISPAQVMQALRARLEMALSP